MLSSKHNMRYFKKFAKNKCVYDCEIVWDCVIVWLIMMKIGPKMKNGSHRYDMNRTRARHGNKCTKYEMRFSKTMVMCNKQHLSKIWSKSHGKVKQHWGWVEKKRCLQKKRVFLNILTYSQEKTYVGIFWIRLQAWRIRPATLKRDSNTGVYLWILQTF